MRQISFAPTFDEWRRHARRALRSGLGPDDVVWEELHPDSPALPMFDEVEESIDAPSEQLRVPKAFFSIAQRVACHRDPARWGLLYALLWRLTHGEPHLLEVMTDPVVHRLQSMEKAIRHDVHKMRAFVRFREVSHMGEAWYVAWFEPQHHIVEWNAPFFRDRFASLNWSILTPGRCVHWDGKELSFTEGVPRAEAPTEDGVESLWIHYYSSIFNPARVKTKAMQAEMPKRYWKNLPEAAVIPTLLREAPRRVGGMIRRSHEQVPEAQHAAIPAPTNLAELREAAARCQACPLYEKATQTVFGEGPADARIVFVGEQPGEQEDRGGRPFIGPAGQLFERALADAGISREAVYVTNAVKHFKWEPRGKRRLHVSPNQSEIAACRPWLGAELSLLRPEVLVLLGATAAKSLAGASVRVLKDRGIPMETEYCRKTLITVHPSSLLRTPDADARESAYGDFVRDLTTARRLLQV